MQTELTGPQQKILRWTIIVYLVVLNTHSFFLEPSHVSPVKIGCMALAPFIFAFIFPVFSKAVVCGLAYWGYCFLSAFYAWRYAVFHHWLYGIVRRCFYRLL